ncbi:MAG: DegT/DnrJ/EryC1/StrS aminotransferase family protein [Treponema sp.]|jgi:dTDP-4-amino-4,6-dideoxygalactose transaminase|nr:DegT/DnrJ/EryC1/StrS aminotransferase family protein [Treponema sp.]
MIVSDIPFARPFIGKEEEEAVLRVLRSGWLTTGKEALAFEKEFAVFLEQEPPAAQSADRPANADRGRPGAPLHCLAVNSATSGLHLALEALGTGPGDLVLLPSYTFTSTAEVVRYLGAESVFVDIAPGSYNIDPVVLEDTLARLEAGKDVPGFKGGKNNVKAVIPVHFGGLPCDMAAITGIARRRGIGVIEDSAHAFPAFCPIPDPDAKSVDADTISAGPGVKPARNRWAGTIGDAGVFSFYATKTITTGEGGMIVTSDPKIAERAARMRNHGIDRTVWNRYTDSNAPWYYEVTAPGFKYNLPDLLAALGRAQLARAADLLSLREDIARRYDAAFGGVPGLLVPPTAPGNARHLYPLRLTGRVSGGGTSGGTGRAPAGPDGTRRDKFIENLRKKGVVASVHFIPLHIMPYYRDRYNLLAEDFPETYNRYRETVSLPIWPGMTAEETERVISAVLEHAGKTGIY